MCCGLIWAEMREQQEVKATGQGENEEGRVESRLFFQISVREVISMLAGRRSNEESSISRLQSSFPTTSCGVVASRWLDELSTSSVQNVDRHVGVGSSVMTACTLVSNHTHMRVHPHMQTLKAANHCETDNKRERFMFDVCKGTVCASF